MLPRTSVALGLALIVLLGAPTLARTQSATPSASSPVAAVGDYSGLVDIGGGRRLYLECAGQGGPTVVLEAGFRTRADLWSDDLIQPEAPRTMVFPGVAAFSRVCAYDRPGTTTVIEGELLPSRSDPVAMPRTAAESVHDLHALLEAAEVPGAYVLVGHSYGGMLMRLYASTYPDEVVGMVLVDAFSEGLKAQMTAEQWSAYAAIFQPVPEVLAGYPDLEFTDLDVSASQVRDATEASPLPPSPQSPGIPFPQSPGVPFPLVVLSRGQPMAMPADLPGGLTGEGLERAWTVEQDRLAALLPGARHVIAGESEHYIQLQQPELVIAAVRHVVDAVRDPSSWATSSASTPSP
jgi:pimeloyl-ACP methyl ester carboxylesterase